MLHRAKLPCHHASSNLSQRYRMNLGFDNACIVTSARMAAGMTSRARRPEIPHSAG